MTYWPWCQRETKRTKHLVLFFIGILGGITMAKVQLILKNEDGKKEVFENLDTTGKDYLNAMTMQEKMQVAKTRREELDLYLEHTRQVFKADKLTDEQILNGLDSASIIKTLDKVWCDVVGIDLEANTDPDEKK